MGLTIQDMILTDQRRYQMRLLAGEHGASNSISWAVMLEGLEIIQNFSGKELVVTTGLGFSSEQQQLVLVEQLVEHHAAGLIINMGEHIKEVPKSVIAYCNENDLPLLTVPWEVYLLDLIKDLSIRLFLQGITDDEITRAMIQAIEEPQNMEAYQKDLRAHFHLEGEFQVVLFTTEGLGEMDTVERRKIGYRLQIYLEKITHNGSFFYYDSSFVLIMNDVGQQDYEEIVDGMLMRAKKRMSDQPIYVGSGSRLKDIQNLYISYQRAKAALTQAKRKQIELLEYDQMGISRMLYMVSDPMLLQEMGEEKLRPLEEYDQKHHANYVETFEYYLKFNGSIQAVAEAMYTHRNTVIYRISNIKKLLHTDLSTTEERMEYQLAYLIRQM